MQRVVRMDEASEEDVYQQLEEKLGVYPVRINYLPGGIGFVEGDVYGDTSSALILYGIGADVKISYNIRLNYQVGSWGKDVEDEFFDGYVMQVNDVPINVNRYKVSDGQERTIASFEYQGVGYSLTFADFKPEEVEEVLNQLYFP